MVRSANTAAQLCNCASRKAIARLIMIVLGRGYVDTLSMIVVHTSRSKRR